MDKLESFKSILEFYNGILYQGSQIEEMSPPTSSSDDEEMINDDP